MPYRPDIDMNGLTSIARAPRVQSGSVPRQTDLVRPVSKCIGVIDRYSSPLFSCFRQLNDCVLIFGVPTAETDCARIVGELNL